jgi:hypothetical protein
MTIDRASTSGKFNVVAALVLALTDTVLTRGLYTVINGVYWVEKLNW